MSALKNRIQSVIADLGGKVESRKSDVESKDLAQAAAAFEKDMQPICNAFVEALHAGDMDALRGLRATLPHLLEDVLKSSELEDVLAHLMGKALIKGLNSGREEGL